MKQPPIAHKKLHEFIKVYAEQQIKEIVEIVSNWTWKLNRKFVLFQLF